MGERQKGNGIHVENMELLITIKIEMHGGVVIPSVLYSTTY